MACLLGALIGLCVYITSLCTELPDFGCSAEEQIPNNEAIWTDDYYICANEVPRVSAFKIKDLGAVMLCNYRQCYVWETVVTYG